MQYSDETVRQLRAQAESIRSRRQSRSGSAAEDRDKYARLSGKKGAIVEPGGFVEVRLLPKWDFFEKRFVKKDNRIVERQGYAPEPCFIEAIEHWYKNAAGHLRRDWCRLWLGEKEQCPVDIVSEGYRTGTEEEEQIGWDMRGQFVYLYNVILRTDQYTEDGKPKIRILVAPPTVCDRLIDIGTGGDRGTKYGKGDLSDPFEGYDIVIGRPSGSGQGNTYTVEEAKQPSRLYEKADAKRWASWWTMLYNLEEIVRSETRTLAELRSALGVRGDAAPPEAGEGAATEVPEDFGAAAGLPEGGGEELPFGELEMPGDQPPPPSPPPASTPQRRSPARGRR